jgi:hypothetical protein
MINRQEIDILVYCARTVTGGEKPHRLRTLLKPDVNWDRVFVAADKHRIVPLVNQCLSAARLKEVPLKALERFRAHARFGAKRNLALAAELQRLLHMFQAHGIQAVPLKGPLLALTAYGDLALRQFLDLDILVRKEDFRQATDLLLGRAYRLMNDHDYEWQFLRTASGTWVDIHWDLVKDNWPYPIIADGLWDRLEAFTLGGQEIRTLGPEDLLLFLCVHGAKHVWQRLSWLCDLAACIRAHPGLDWPGVVQLAKRLGSQRMLFLGVLLASDVLGAGIPRGVLRPARADGLARFLAVTIQRRFYAEADELLYPHNRFRLMMHGPPRHRSWYVFCDYYQRYFSRWVTPCERDRALIALPPFLHFLYYPLRFLRLVRTYGWRPWTRGIKREDNPPPAAGLGKPAPAPRRH